MISFPQEGENVSGGEGHGKGVCGYLWRAARRNNETENLLFCFQFNTATQLKIVINSTTVDDYSNK
jgi:hypothetical protein